MSSMTPLPKLPESKPRTQLHNGKKSEMSLQLVLASSVGEVWNGVRNFVGGGSHAVTLGDGRCYANDSCDYVDGGSDLRIIGNHSVVDVGA